MAVIFLVYAVLLFVVFLLRVHFEVPALDEHAMHAVHVTLNFSGITRIFVHISRGISIFVFILSREMIAEIEGCGGKYQMNLELTFANLRLSMCNRRRSCCKR